jgi:iron complex outermembrane receptor protein
VRLTAWRILLLANGESFAVIVRETLFQRTSHFRNMSKTFILLAGLVAVVSNAALAANRIGPDGAVLSGKIIEKRTGMALPGVTVYFPDLKTGTTSDANGNYKFENLPRTRTLVQVSFVGYKLIAEVIDLSVVSTRDFALEESAVEINEVVVTGLSQSIEKNKTPAPISTIAKTELLQMAATNIIDAIASQPGISQITTGAGISKPVIRGLGYNRVVTVNDCIRQEGQQWGDEHGIEIDEFAVSKVEILKGPASLSYGSDAMAGVVNFLSAPTLSEGKIQGNILANYQTNDGLIGLSGNIAGNLKGLIWDVRYSNKMAHAYKNQYDGYVFNSGYKEQNFSGIVGVNKSWGYSHLHFSVYNFTPGIVEGERDSATGKFVKPVALNETTIGKTIATDKDFKSYTPLTPYQQIHHYKAVLNNSFILGNGNLKTTFGWQQNQRQEYADVLTPGRYGLYFLLNTINYDIRYNLPEHNHFNLAFGVNGMQQSSQNKGVEFLVPEYNLFDAGVFAIARKSFDKLDISGGLRYDSRTEHGKDLFLDASGNPVAPATSGASQRFAAFDATFTGVSGSIGAAYQFSDRFFTKFNVSRGFRAPNIGEIGANGVHDGTVRYEIGDPKLKAETSLQLDYALGMNTEHITAEFDLFSNTINNFIYPRKLNSAAGGDSLTGGYQTFKFFAANANLVGGEFSIDIHPHPLDWLHFENSFSYVRAVQKGQPDSTRYLPFTPAPKWSSEIRANAKVLSKIMRNAYAKVEVDHYFTQNDFYAAYGTETATPGYTLVNLGLGTDFVSGDKTRCSLYLSVNNLTDVAYQSHLSRLKYEAVNFVTSRTGVFNMGRNISLKLLVPLQFGR